MNFIRIAVLFVANCLVAQAVFAAYPYIKSDSAIRDSVTPAEVIAIARENCWLVWPDDQCLAFVQAVSQAAGQSYNSLTAQASYNGRVTQTSWLASNIQPGDMLRFHWIYGPHSVVVVAINATTMTYIDNSGNYTKSPTWIEEKTISLRELIGKYALQDITVYRVNSTPYPDNAGNSISGAKNLGYLTSSATESSDWVGLYDREDYYKFRVSAASDVKVTLSGYGDVDVAAFYSDSNGTLIRYSQAIVPKTRKSMSYTWQTQETFSIACQPNTDYYVKVYGNLPDNKYIMWAKATAKSIQPDGAGNSFDASRNLGYLKTIPAKYSDSVGTADTADYYKFQLASAGNIVVSVSDFSKPIYMDIFNSAKSRVGRSISGTTNKLNYYSLLPAGTYYIKVYIANSSNSTNYNMQVYAR